MSWSFSELASNAVAKFAVEVSHHRGTVVPNAVIRSLEGSLTGVCHFVWKDLKLIELLRGRVEGVPPIQNKSIRWWQKQRANPVSTTHPCVLFLTRTPFWCWQLWFRFFV